MSKRTDIVKIAQSQIGNSWQKYCSWWGLSYRFDWCACFVSWCAEQVGCLGNIIPKSTSCTQQSNGFKAQGVWHGRNYTPQAGDIVYYDWTPNNADTTPDHVGIVEKVAGNQVIVIEGNQNDKCQRRTFNVGWYLVYGYASPKYPDDSASTPSNSTLPAPAPSEPTKNQQVDVWYCVRTKAHGWLGWVKNLEDYAGWQDSPITDISIRVSAGKIKYRVHIKGGGWLPYVTGADIYDYVNGYAGCGVEIDAIEVYYYTPDSIRPYKKATYRVAPCGRDYYEWQHDNETSGNQDGYAGSFGVSIGKFQLLIA